VVVDHARRRLAQKRGQGQRGDAAIDVEGLAGGRLPPDENVLALGEALQRLEHEDPELLAVVDRMFFGGQTAAEAAADLGVSSRTVERRWRFARAWLHEALGGGEARN
jgi:DNA-directed RNA polymerase specialized sigma24 family protein